jgi:chitin synthase
VRNRGILPTTTLRRTLRSGKSLDLNSCRESDNKSRYSTVSYSETGVTPSQGFDASTMESFANAGGSRPRYDSNQLLTLPAPLALNRPATYGGSSSSVTRSSEDVHSDQSSSHHRLVSSPTTEQPDYGASASTPSRRASPGRGHQSARATSNHGTARQAIAQTPFPGEANPFQSSQENYHGVEQDVGSSASPSPSGRRSRARGVSLSDNGPVPPPDGVRRVSRPARRTSQPPQQNRYSRTTSLYASLPPGAAPPNPNGGHN